MSAKTTNADILSTLSELRKLIEKIEARLSEIDAKTDKRFDDLAKENKINSIKLDTISVMDGKVMVTAPSAVKVKTTETKEVKGGTNTNASEEPVVPKATKTKITKPTITEYFKDKWVNDCKSLIAIGIVTEVRYKELNAEARKKNAKATDLVLQRSVAQTLWSGMSEQQKNEVRSMRNTEENNKQKTLSPDVSEE